MAFDTYLSKPDDSLWKELKWEPSKKQLEQFLELQGLLLHWNKRVNLTRLTKGDDYWVGQVFDSIWPFTKFLNKSIPGKKIIDVGSGCGLPGLAIAIALPNATLTLVDAISRKSSALEQITIELGLQPRVSIRNERIETTGQNIKYRGQFDFATARAVATAPTTAEYLVPLLKKDGEALLYRGKWNQLDQKQLSKAITPLKAIITKSERQILPKGKGIRTLIRLSLAEDCPPKYPRPIGIPTKKPLGN